MKSMKKLNVILLSVVMILTMAMTAFAYDITLESGESKPTDGHTYDIYQIFKGELAEGVLVNITYGANYLPDGKTAADLVSKAELDEIDLLGASEFAKKLLDEDLLKGDAVASLNAANNWSATDLDAGYYLIVEKTAEPPKGETFSSYIVKVVDNVIMNPKSGVTSIDKIISDDYNTIEGDISDDQKFDNVSIGTNVEFTLTAPILTNAGDFDFCYFIINDTLFEGFTFNDDITVTIGGVAAVEGEDYVVYTGDEADGYTFRVALLDAKSHPSADVVVKYTAMLNEKAVIGAIDGNPNEANLTYSNNPNYDYEDTHVNGKPAYGKNPPLGETVDIITRTYTTGLKVMKVDEKGNALAGASFELKGENVVNVLVSREVFTEAEGGQYWLLKNGSYTKTAPITEPTYIEKTTDRDSGFVLDNGEYRAATDIELADETITLYILIEANTEDYADLNKKYTKSIETNVETVRSEKKVEAEVGENGVLIFEGLGEGKFTITETKTPAGYNTIEAFDVIISWDPPVAGSKDCTWTVKTADGKNLSINDEGIFELEVINHSGIVLPETGGMGTTIFYIVGSIFVVCAVVLLVTRKRMTKND